MLHLKSETSESHFLRPTLFGRPCLWFWNRHQRSPFFKWPTKGNRFYQRNAKDIQVNLSFTPPVKKGGQKGLWAGKGLFSKFKVEHCCVENTQPFLPRCEGRGTMIGSFENRLSTDSSCPGAPTHDRSSWSLQPRLQQSLRPVFKSGRVSFERNLIPPKYAGDSP